MREFLKTKGYAPGSNLDVASPSKVYGNHPLASNKIRQYHLRISQTNRSDEAEQITKTIVCKLMSLAKNMENHVLALCPFNLSSKESKIWHKEAVVKKATGWSDHIGNIDHVTWQKKLQIEIIIETSLDIAYVLNVTSARSSPECESFNNEMKTLNSMLKIIDVEESNLEPAALVVRMIKYYDEKTCLNEIHDRLRETSSYEVDEGNIQIRWGPVSTPSDETMKIVMGTIMAHKTIAESLTDKLIDLNNTPHQELYPHTGMWIFYRGKEDDMSLNTMKDGIRAQREYMEQTETITVGGLGNYRLDEIRPAMKINRQGNSANHTAAQLIVLNIDDPAPAPASPVSPAGSNSRQRRKERRAAERGATTTSPAAATMQPPDTKTQEPVSVFQQEMDRLAAARDDFCNNPPQFEDLLLSDSGVTITANTIEYTEAMLEKATQDDLVQIRLMNWPPPDPKHPTIYRVPISNSEGHVPLKSDSAHSHFDAIVSALYWIEYSKRGLSDPSLPQPSSARPYHYKPIDFALYDINAPQKLGITTTEELVDYLSVEADNEELGQDMEEESPAPKDNSKANPPVLSRALLMLPHQSMTKRL
eukprot:scaffold49256_cov25-Cyclotella_meneghiniana.AAC.2